MCTPIVASVDTENKFRFIYALIMFKVNQAIYVNLAEQDASDIWSSRKPYVSLAEQDASDIWSSRKPSSIFLSPKCNGIKFL
jgi:hypothetical protein